MFNHIAACDQIELLVTRDDVIGEEIANASISRNPGRLQVESSQSAESLADFDAGGLISKASEGG